MSLPEALIDPYTLASIALAGWLAQRALGIDARWDRLAFAGRMFGLGAGLNALLVLLLYLSGCAQFGFAGLAVLQVLGFGLLAWIAQRREPRPLSHSSQVRRSNSAARAFFAVCLIAVLALTVAVLIDGQGRPALVGDDANHWGMRAQALFAAGGFGEPFRELHYTPFYPPHADYPLWNPLLRVWASLAMGEFSFVHGLLGVQVVFVGTLLLLGSALRRLAGNVWAGLGLVVCFAHGTALPLVRNGFSEGLLAFGLLLSIDSALRASSEGDPRFAKLVPVGLALALFAKNDALLFVGVAAAVLGIGALFGYRRRAHASVLRAGGAAWALPALAIALWWGINRWHGFENDLLSGKGSGESLAARWLEQGAERLPQVLRYFAVDVLGSAWAGGLVWWVWALAIAIGWRRARATGWLDVALFAIWLGLALIYATSPQELNWHLATSAARVVWPLAPLALVAAASRTSAAQVQ